MKNTEEAQILPSIFHGKSYMYINFDKNGLGYA
jgi:hypothetical protein